MARCGPAPYSAAIARHACERRGVGLLPVLQGPPVPKCPRAPQQSADAPEPVESAPAADEEVPAGGGDRASGSGAAARRAGFFLDEFVLHRGAVAALHASVVEALAPGGFGRPLAGNCLCSLSNSRASGRSFVVQQGGKRVVRENLFALATLHACSVLEVGFNAGHSAALFCFAWTSACLAEPRAAPFRYRGFDICEHPYARPCFEALQGIYCAEVEMELVEGDSTVTMRPECDEACDSPANGGFDLVHIDGCHTPRVAREDVLNARRFAAGPRLLLFDDATLPGLPELLDELVSARVIADVAPGELQGFTPTRLHRLFRYL